MELAHARALIAVGELGSFNKAGERLQLSPPAVFAQIHQLETELNTKLYERAGRKLILTPAGRLLIDYCRRMILTHDEAVGAVKEWSGARGGSLCLGCAPHLNVSVVPHLLRAFVSRCPEVELQLIIGNDQVLLDGLRSGKVDLLLLDPPVDGANLVQDPLWRGELVFVVPPGGPASGAPAEEAVTATELSARPFILYLRGAAIETAVRQFCAAAGFEPKVIMQNDQAESIKELVKLGLGTSLLPWWSVSEDVRNRSLRILRLADRPLFSVTGLLYGRTSQVPPPVRRLIDVAHQWKSWLPRAEEVREIGD